LLCVDGAHDRYTAPRHGAESFYCSVFLIIVCYFSFFSPVVQLRVQAMG
jgi:hypothetical protein